MKINQFTNTSSNWRNILILRYNLATIRDTIYTIEFALDELLEALSRISLNRHDSRYKGNYISLFFINKFKALTSFLNYYLRIL